MPSDELLDVLYGPDYESNAGVDPGIPDPRDPALVCRWLEELGRGVFVDFGCGAGDLLSRARSLGWETVGVERDVAVASRTAAASGARVVQKPSELGEGTADVLHLGDVLEHLTQLDQQFPAILRLIKPRGWLLAQGPLEAQANLFNLVIRISRRLRGSPTIDTAPYHVILATSRGQRHFFERFGLEEREYRIREVAWPAPERIFIKDVAEPRRLSLFALRHASRAVGTLIPGFGGNRYFYAGVRNSRV